MNLQDLFLSLGASCAELKDAHLVSREQRDFLVRNRSILGIRSGKNIKIMFRITGTIVRGDRTWYNEIVQIFVVFGTQQRGTACLCVGQATYVAHLNEAGS